MINPPAIVIKTSDDGSGTVGLKLLKANPISEVFEPMKVSLNAATPSGRLWKLKVHGRLSSDEAESSVPSGDSSEASTWLEWLSTSTRHCSVPLSGWPSISQISPESSRIVCGVS